MLEYTPLHCVWLLDLSFSLFLFFFFFSSFFFHFFIRDKPPPLWPPVGGIEHGKATRERGCLLCLTKAEARHSPLMDTNFLDFPVGFCTAFLDQRPSSIQSTLDMVVHLFLPLYILDPTTGGAFSSTPPRRSRAWVDGMWFYLKGGEELELRVFFFFWWFFFFARRKSPLRTVEGVVPLLTITTSI